MREKTDLTEVILQGQLVDYLLATGAFAVPKLYPEVLYRRWDVLKHWYLSAERSSEMREYVAATVVAMFACPDPYAQMVAVDLGWLLRLDEMVIEMKRVVVENSFDELESRVQSGFLNAIAKMQLSELADFFVHQSLRQKRLNSLLMPDTVILKKGDLPSHHDLWRIWALAQYYEKSVNQEERQQIEQMLQEWGELRRRVGPLTRLSVPLQKFLDEHRQTFPLFSSKVQELLAYLEKDPMG